MYCGKMALVIMMWIYFITISQYVQCKVITISSDGEDTTDCCKHGTCPCSSLSRALHSIESNTIVDIMSENVSLDDFVPVEKVNNITLTGNDVRVMCNNIGGVSWRSGDNILIEGITWDQCGNAQVPTTSAFEFDNVYNIAIIKCTFQHSKVCKAVSLSAEGGNMSVYIANSKFQFNKVENSSACQDSLNLSVIYCFLRSPLNLSIIIEDSIISSNEILGTLLYSNANHSHILFNNVTVLNNSRGGLKMVSTGSDMKVDVLSSNFSMNSNSAVEGAYDSQGVALYFTARDNSIIHLFNSSFEYNNASHGDNIVYIAAQDQTGGLSNNITVLVNGSTFSNNQLGSVLHLSHVMVAFYNSTLFQNNMAEAGAAIYVDQNSLITVTDESLVQFINNSALLRGGAIYSDLTNCINKGIFFSSLSNISSVKFINNAARISGNSIYFNIPKSCSVERDYTKNDSVAYIPHRFKYTQSDNIIGPPVAASPHRINLCSHKCCSTGDEKTCVITGKRMLGQLFSFSATVCDYFNVVAETVQFRMECTNCDTRYRLLNNELLFNSKSPNKISILTVGADNDVVNDTNITLKISSVLSDNYKEFSAELSFILSTCYNGFVFRIASQECECYNNSDDNIVRCQEDHAEIKLGYWYGIIFDKLTTSLCPINFCDFNRRMKTRSDYYALPSAVDDQCSSHRTGVVCSDCKPGYTLSYDSSDCVNISQCSPGMTVLVIGLTFLYWIVITAALCGLAYYLGTQVSSGYFNGVIYFYSIVDILLIRNLYIVDGVFYAVAGLSTFAKLTPQVLGRLCFIQGLDAIDQQFIHYSHAMCISLILIGIAITAKYVRKIAFYVNRCIACVTFLFLVLSYTSVTSTSLQLLRGIQYNDNDGVFVYLSPHFKYFTHRHAVYATVALLCGLTVSIGLPLLLLIEPFLRNKAVFKRFMQTTKLRPILDQFQDSYKVKYQCFAANYFLCRLVIMLIAYFGNSDYNNMVYYMQTACVIFVINQLLFRPYKIHALNMLDTAILLTVLLVVNLNNYDFTEPTMVGLVYTLLFIPLLLLFAVGLAKPIKALRMKWKIFNSTPMIKRNVLYEPDYDDFTDFEEPLVMTEIPTALPRTYRSTCQLEMNVNLNLQ